MSELFEQTIKERIFQGEYPIGSSLKSERTYATEFGISSNKVHRALQKLVNEGYLSSRRGSGYSVNSELKCTPGQIRAAYIFPAPNTRTNELLRLRAPRENIWVDAFLCDGSREDYSCSIIEVLEGRRHDIILLQPNYHQLSWVDGLSRALAQHFPLIFYDYQEMPNVFPMVGPNHFEFGFLGARVLAENGYREAIYLGYGEGWNYAARMRWLGFEAGCKLYGLNYEPLKLALGEEIALTNGKLDHFLNSPRKNRPALFASTGSFTYMAVNAFARHGIRPPDKLGFLASDFTRIEGQNFTSSCIAGNPDHTVSQIIRLVKTTIATRSLSDTQCISITPIYQKGESL